MEFRQYFYVAALVFLGVGVITLPFCGGEAVLFEPCQLEWAYIQVGLVFLALGVLASATVHFLKPPGGEY